MNRQTCRADKAGAVTSNTTLSSTYKTNLVAELLLIPAADRIKSKAGNQRFIAYQTSIDVTGYADKLVMIPRTFEESFIYTNLLAIRSGLLKTFTPLPAVLNFETDYNSVYETVKSKGYKKVEFALLQLATNHKWLTPTYICDGLEWLNKVVAPLTLGALVESKAP